MLKTNELSKVFRTEEVETTALNQVSIHVKKGEFVGIMGPSGCGKTTLMRMIAGLEKPTSGVISIGGLDVTGYLDVRNLLNFRNVLETARRRPPFGIAQVGKSFRNEITPGNFVFRTREFEQMEMEFFVPPAEAQQWHDHWMQARMDWYVALGIDRERLRLRGHDADELSHYSSGTSDVEFLFPWGWDELEGIANRGDYDLTAHANHSGEKLDYFDQATNERYTPHVIEPAAGATRTMMAVRMAAYD